MKKTEEKNRAKNYEKYSEFIISNNSEKILNKKFKNIAKTYFYRKIKINTTNIIGKSKTFIDSYKHKKKKNKKGKKEKKEIIPKKINEESERRYTDSTLLVKSEKEKEKNNIRYLEYQ